MVCDQDWTRKIRKIIDDGEHDIDNIWRDLCQWHVIHKEEWIPKDSFTSMIEAMHYILGRLYNDILDNDDKRRWKLVKGALGNVRFGGRGELDYPSFDKVQHFLGGAHLGKKYLANVVGTGVECFDAIKRLFKDYITHNREKHHVGYDMHDMEWTWAGGAFSGAITDQSSVGIDKILTEFANSELVLSGMYTSVMPNKDPSEKYRDNPHIDHADWTFPSPIEYPAKAMLINSQI